MPRDPWLPVGLRLPGGLTCRATVLEGPDWQIIETDGRGRALVVEEQLGQRWARAGLVNEGAFQILPFGERKLRVVASDDRHVIVPLEVATSPSSQSEAIAFAIAMRDTRRIDPVTPLHDGIYVERISRILPTWSPSHPLTDDMVLGRWLSGGVRISAQAFRRLSSLLSWLPPDELLEVIEVAGICVPEDQAPTRMLNGVSDAMAGDAAFPGSGSSSDGRSKRRFRLPGRADLERFFREHIIDIVEHSERYKALGIEFPSAVVLHGPPGCGKTFAVEKLVDYLGWPSFSIDSSTIGSPFIHETGKKIAKAFDDALRASPSVVVIDEMESFLSDRQLGGGQGLHHVEEVAEFLRRIPEAIQNHVLVIGMTNKIEMIDAAILRRGRFDHVIQVGMPTEEEVRSLLAELLASRPGGREIDTTPVVTSLLGRPLSDASFVVREAARLAARSGRTSLDQASIDDALRSLPPRAEGGSQSTPIGFRRA